MNTPRVNTPNIRYYAKLEYSTEDGKKTPKYTITEWAGYYPPMEKLRGRDGRISFNLMDNLMNKKKEGMNIPSMRLQAKGSLNLTGLKEYFADGKLSGFAYGYPDSRETYSSKNKPNPFFEYRDDGFLFVVHQNPNDPTSITPIQIELIVLEKARVLIPAYLKQLMMGGFDKVLAQLREQAKTSMPI